MINISQVITSLASQRPVFHSEADFQHAFAWEIHRQLPAASIRLELPLQPQGKSIHLDIWATQKELALAVELKYKTRALSVRIGDEQFMGPCGPWSGVRPELLTYVVNPGKAQRHGSEAES